MRLVCVWGLSETVSKVVVEGEVRDVGFVWTWRPEEEVDAEADVGRGWEIAFWPVITVPSSRPAEI